MKNYVALVLDKSGSMGSVQREAMSNFNEQLQEIRKNAIEKEIKTRATVVLFDSIVKFVRKDTEIKRIEELTEREYYPSGTTALFDAVGETILKFKKIYSKEMKEEDSSFLIIIFTDGFENTSREWNVTSIKKEIKELEETGKWTFTFVGTKDALNQADYIGIKNTLSIQTTADGMADYSVTNIDAFRNYYENVSRGLTATSSFFDTNSVNSSDEDEKDGN